MISFPSETFSPNKQKQILHKIEADEKLKSCLEARKGCDEKILCSVPFFGSIFAPNFSSKPIDCRNFWARHETVVMSQVKMSWFNLGVVFICCFADRWRPILAEAEAEAQTFYVQSRPSQQARSNPIQEGFFKLPSEYQQKKFSYSQPNGQFSSYHVSSTTFSFIAYPELIQLLS